MTSPAGARTPVHVLTGFLGSGKTTLLNRLLREDGLAGTAVIVNELGEIGIDHLLVERSDDRLVELSGGCLCCAVRGDLSVTLTELLARRDAGDCLAFERVVIETTGLADPVPVLNLLATDPGLAERVIPGRVITTLDAVNGLSTLERHPEAVRQVALADCLVITKPELVPGGVDALARRAGAINPAARQVHAEHGRLGADAGGVLEPRAVPDEARGRPGPGLHAHGSGIDTFTVVREDPVPGAALALLIETLAHHLGARLLRVKGLVALAEAPATPAVLHGAQHVFHPLDFLPGWPDDDRCTRLVFIGEGIRQDWVEAVLDGLIDEVEQAGRRLGADRSHHEEE